MYKLFKMRLFYLTIFFAWSLQLQAQEQIGKTKAEVREFLKQETSKKEKDVTRKIMDHDSSITLQLNNKAAASTVNFVFTFNDKGICLQEKIHAEKAEWIGPYLEKALAKENFGFKKINEHQYISLFDKKVFLELPPEGIVNSFNMFRVDWSRDMYDILSKSENGVKE